MRVLPEAESKDSRAPTPLIRATRAILNRHDRGVASDNELTSARRNPGRGDRDQKYWDLMVTLTDDMVGKLVARLEELGLRKNTLVIFTADNGTYAGITSVMNGRTIQGGKGSPKDAGTHVPFIVSWPGSIKGGQVVDDLVGLSDVLPTITEVAGIERPPALNSACVSLAPLLRGEEREKDYIYCWYQRNGIRDQASQHTRNQRYKLYANGVFVDSETDPEDKVNLMEACLTDDLKPIHAELYATLQRHLSITAKAGPVQEAKRTGKK